MIILVTGASGFIGVEVCKELSRRGHTVIGLVRDAKKGVVLQQHEVKIIVGDLQQLENPALLAAIDQAQVIIDLVLQFPPNNLKFVQLVRERATALSVPKRFIYTSGFLVYGNQPGLALDEGFPTRHEGRILVEEEVLKKDPAGWVSGVVLRPGMVYGLGAGHIGRLFQPNQDGEIEIFGNPDKQWAWVHVSDVAEAYALASEHPAAAGEAFDLVDGITISTAGEIQIALARANGVEGKVKYSPAKTDPLSQLFERQSWLTGAKLRTRLGWSPRHPPVLAPGNVERALTAWRAHTNPIAN